MAKHLRHFDPICLLPKKWARSQSWATIIGVPYIGHQLLLRILCCPFLKQKWASNDLI